MDPMEKKDGIQMIQVKTFEETEAEMRTLWVLSVLVGVFAVDEGGGG